MHADAVTAGISISCSQASMPPTEMATITKSASTSERR